mgnify:CR=1 FL=1
MSMYVDETINRAMRVIQRQTYRGIFISLNHSTLLSTKINVLHILLIQRIGYVQRSVIMAVAGPATSSAQFHLEFTVPRDQLLHTVGPKGKILQRIASDTVTKIFVSQADDTNDTVHIDGTEGGCRLARSQLLIAMYGTTETDEVVRAIYLSTQDVCRSNCLF